jgi:hypothetical protein
MAFNPKEIREALAEQLRQNVARGINYFAYRPANPPVPYVAVICDDPYVGYHETFATATTGALCDVRFMIEIGHSGEAQSAQIFIDELLASGTGQQSSVIDAIEADRTIGGTVETCIVLRAGPITPTDPDRSAHFALVPLQIALRRS